MRAPSTLLPLLLAFLWSATPSYSAPSATTEHVEVSLLAEAEAARPGETLWLGLRFALIPEWHVYWRNPGDSGEAPRVDWGLPQGWRAGAIRWPLPERIRVGPLTNYGYADEVTLLVPVQVPEAAPEGVVQVAAQARWLVCKEACVPEQATLTLDLPVARGPAIDMGAAAESFQAVRSRLPVPLGTQATYTVEGDEVVLRLGDGAWGDGAWPVGRIRDLWLAAHDWGPIDPSGEQRWAVSKEGLRLAAPLGDAPPAGPLPGLLVLEEDLGGETVTRGFTLSASPSASPGEPPGAGMGLWLAVTFALLGGLILNVMPCVLPVLSIKVMGLVAHAADERPAAHAVHGLAYAGGVLAAFAALAGALLALRAGGESLGWGFQLQSPLVVTALAYLMLLVGLNLSGVYEVGGRLMGLGQQGPGAARAHGVAGSALTGVLAAVVASPCTAPFMGAALGFALTQPAGHALAVFLALGLGFALPVLALSFAPGWTRHLPRPGPWMERLRRVLAFPMYAAAAWLVWVLAQQTGPEGLAAALAGLVVLALAAWLYGEAGRGWRRAGLAALLAAVAAVALALAPHVGGGRGVVQAAPADAWSPERLADLREQGRAVLVNFTAAWCITCKVNERVALATPAVSAALTARGVAYLKGDWTRRDPRIGRELRRYGRSGVPLYLLYPAPGGEPRVLPQLLTEGLVLDALARL